MGSAWCGNTSFEILDRKYILLFIFLKNMWFDTWVMMEGQAIKWRRDLLNIFSVVFQTGPLPYSTSGNPGLIMTWALLHYCITRFFSFQVIDLNEIYLLIGQLVGMVTFTEQLSGSVTSILTLEKMKFTVAREDHFLMVFSSIFVFILRTFIWRSCHVNFDW